MSQLLKQQLREASDYLLAVTPRRPRVGIVLGSGLAGVADKAEGAQSLTFEAIPHLASPTVVGHPGRLVVGRLYGKDVALLQGRLHAYEGYSPWQVTFPVRLLSVLGVRTLIVTNAAGALNPDFQSGDLMLISDHINLASISGLNPLSGLSEALGPRFVSMGSVYDPGLRRLATSTCSRLAIRSHTGVYIMVHGPSYETNAELRMLRLLGGDAVGMSTASEAIVAVQLGMSVLGVSCITNQASGMGHAVVSHHDVLAKGSEAAPRLAALIEGFVNALPA